jgi:hypothetical protein
MHFKFAEVGLSFPTGCAAALPKLASILATIFAALGDIRRPTGILA